MRTPLLHLRFQISNPKKIVELFCRYDSSFRNYDLHPILQDNKLRPEEIRLSHKMGARFTNRLIPELLQNSNLIEKALMQIPPSFSILETSKRIPWGPLQDLYRACMIPGMGEANITKILHKKRPQLIPILDSILTNKYLRPMIGTERLVRPEKRFVNHIKHLKFDVDANKDLLVDLSGKFGLSPVRIIDIIIWTHFVRPRWLHVHKGLGGQPNPTTFGRASCVSAPSSIPIKARQTAAKSFGVQSFTKAMLYQAYEKDWGTVKKDSFLVADWTVNKISGYSFNSQTHQWHKRHQIFYERHDGFLELYNPTVHGTWARRGNQCCKIP